jgi:arylsulfatase A-like enzyme
VLLLAVDGLDARGASPHLAALAGRARRFDLAFAPHAQPGPARLALFTGRGPQALGVWTEPGERPPDTVLMPEHFRRAGYWTARVGRAVGGALEAQVAWDHAGPARGHDTAGHLATLLAEKRAQPFFIAAAFDELGPVLPVAGGGPPGPERPALAFADLPGPARAGARRRVAAATDAQRAQARKRLEDRMRRFDAALATVMTTLDAQGLRDSTVVVVVGTHGVDRGTQGALPRPDVLFEDALRVPLVIAAPGVAAGPAAALAQTTDVFPTLAELAALPAVAGLDGRSLAPALRDAAQAGREAAVSVARRDAGTIGRSVRTGSWRYTEWPDGSAELYDHGADPHEQRNLAGDARHGAQAARLRALIDAEPAGARGPAGRAGGRRPNVVLLVFDDMNVHLGAYGFPVRTPNFDRLAARGRRFERAYAQVAMCSPSRTSFLSGWRPQRTGIWDNNDPPRRPGMVPLQEHFKAHGYFTASVGKVWETRFASDFHWDLAEHDPGTEAEPGRRGPRRAPRGLADVSQYWTKTDNRDEEEPDGRRARRAAALLAEKRDKPLFLAVGFVKPHLRWIAPRSYFDLYDPAAVVLPPEPADDAADIPELAVEFEATRPGALLGSREPPTGEALRRQAIAAYYATVTFVDAQLGVVLDALDRLKLWDDTVVVALGDNGFHLGEHRGLWRKDTLFEEALRVPLVVSAPGLALPGASTAAHAELLDLYPTLTELAGIPAPAGLDGRTLVPLLRDPRAEGRAAAYSYRMVSPPPCGVSLRTARHRYTQWPDGSEELFDLSTDPDGVHDVAGRPDQAETLLALRALRARLEEPR